MDKAERLLDLVALLLDAREPISFAELRDLFPEEYGGSRAAAERKLERDKADLLELGVPIEYVEPGDERELGGYRLDRKSFFLPDPGLLPEESAALYAAGAAALSTREFPFAHDLQHALRKISLAGDTHAVGTEAAGRLLVVRPGDPLRAEKLRTLGDAVARRKRVHLYYEAPPGLDGTPGKRSERDVEPWGLAFRGRAWRLLARDPEKGQRVFLVDRIARIEVNAQKPHTADFEPPEGFDAADAAQRSSKPWLWAHHAEEIVQLRFAPGSEAIGARMFDAPDGVLRVTNLDGLVPQLLSLGDRVSVESPAVAREKVRAALQRIEEKLRGLAEPPPDPFAVPPAGVPAERGRTAEPELKRERLRRLLLVVPAARRRPGILLADLALELGLTEQELREDIDLLGVVGRPPFSPDDLIDISIDERDRVAVALDQSFSRPPQLTPLEALALAAAAEELAPTDPAIRAALDKLTGQLPPRARELYTQLAGRVAVATPAPRGAQEILGQLRSAAEQRREVGLQYDKDGRGSDGERIFRPHAVIDHAGSWYVIGHDVGRSGERTFRIDRIVAVRETGNTFPDPGPPDAARFQREELFFPTGREQVVILRFSASAAGWALQRYGSRARLLADGRAEVLIESAGTGYAVQLALSFAGEAEIAAPVHAREALRAEVERALRRAAESP